ncbi:MAG: hypothetical protein PWQ64_614 [Desulfomicrobiaceae bacterium]|jgi:hypothetical protein|nr:hypothetical protein [Desulfomicrobiaceae bacterium]MDK2872850.1 hypothetical protein [Desulfomicrobiaceae bacterium]
MTPQNQACTKRPIIYLKYKYIYKDPPYKPKSLSMRTLRNSLILYKEIHVFCGVLRNNALLGAFFKK